MVDKWITFFSQTGAEICDIAESLNKWPDVIVTNERPEHLRKIDERLDGKVSFVPNKPTVDDYERIIPDGSLVTLHGWLRVVPPSICDKHLIYNGHPGLITKYPELKGKDPQVRAFEGKYDTAGAVIHKVTAGVDEGKIIMSEEFNAMNLSLDQLFNVLKDRSLYMWNNLLRQLLDV